MARHRDNLLTKFPSIDQLKSEPEGHALAYAWRRLDACEADVRAWAYLPTKRPGLDLAPREGPLAGIPFGVKDVIHVAGMPTQCGSQIPPSGAAPMNAASVELLVRAGAIPIGKTVTAEYAFRQPGPTRNPANLQHTPGGSSSGSAAAVAAGMVPFALSTQTGGSIIRPAAYCGATAFKPSFGLLSRDGLKLTCESLDVIGWHAADMTWLQACAEVLIPNAAPPSPVHLRGANIAIIDFSSEETASDEASAVLQDAVRTLHQLGATCQRIDARAHLTALSQAHAIIMKYEFARNLQPVVARDSTQLSPALLENVRQGWNIAHAEYRDMRALQRTLRASWATFTENADFILSHSAAGAAPAGHVFTGAPAFNKCWSVLGWPCLHLPVRLSHHGLPLGVQLIGKFEQDFDLITYGTQLESQLTGGANQ